MKITPGNRPRELFPIARVPEKNFSHKGMIKMTKNTPKRESIKRRTIEYMKQLGTYKTQYNQVIEVYADMLYQYNILSKKFEEDNFEVVIETERSGGKKTPILASLENLRKDIGTYSDRLMLNAKTYNAEIEQPKKEKSTFAKLLEGQNI